MNIVIRALEQCGISPKVKVPSVVLAALGAACLAVALILDDETFTEVGLAVLAASGVTFGTGYAANPGTVVVSGDDTHVADELFRREQQQSYPPAGQAGYGLIEALVVIFLVLVILVVLFRLV
jgi:hypothetical protein